jgi:hypothetical protein
MGARPFASGCVLREVHDDIWLVSFMQEIFSLQTRVLEPLENPSGPKVSPMS